MKLTKEQFLELEKFLNYEISSSLWNSLLGWNWLLNLIASYYVRKTRRKYARYLVYSKYNFKGKPFEETVPEHIEHGAPFDETVPDETTPPEDVPDEFAPETIFKDRINDTINISAEAEINAATRILFPEHDKKSEKRGPRGPYKKKNKDTAIVKSTQSDQQIKPLKYITASTAEAVRNGKDMFLPGAQATKNKFIVGGAYIKGRLDEARAQYKEYLDKGIQNNDEILTWESWLSFEYAKEQQPQRKITGD